MRRDVVTLYFCGSGNDRNMGATNALPHLYENTAGNRKAIFDGPGGAKILKTEEIMKMVESGKDSKPGLKVWKSLSERKEKSWNKMLSNYHNDTTTSMTGTGTQSNIVMALQWLWLEWYKERFVDINLAGFSRGGVSCIMLAHAIQEAGFTELGNIRVNIFTFDPVPGSLNDFKNKGTFSSTGRAGKPSLLPPCVSSYCSILQENIKKFDYGILPKDRTFKCVVPDYTGSNPSRMPRELYPMPGGHSASQAYTSGPGTGEIGIHLAQEFLERNGTKLNCGHKLNAVELIEAYSAVRFFYTKKVGTYGKKRKPSYHRGKIVNNPFREHEFFINSHHASLMYMHAGDVARCIDEGAELSTTTQSRMAQTMPQTLRMLEGMGYLN